MPARRSPKYTRVEMVTDKEMVLLRRRMSWAKPGAENDGYVETWNWDLASQNRGGIGFLVCGVADRPARMSNDRAACCFLWAKRPTGT